MNRSLLAAAYLSVWAISSHAQAPAKPRFLLLTPFVDYAFFAPMKQGASDAAKALGVDTGATLIEAKDADYQGIGINMIDAQAFDAVAAEATKKGVPLISFNVDDAKMPNARLATVGIRSLSKNVQTR